MSGTRRPYRSPNHPKMNAPTGRIISVIVIAKATCSIVFPNSCPTDEKTNVSRKKSSASSVQPRKQAMKVLRCARLSDLKSRTASTSSHLNVMSSKVETSLRGNGGSGYARPGGDMYCACSIKRQELQPGGWHNHLHNCC